MQQLDEDGRIWYPCHPDGSFDTARRPQIKRYLNEQEGSIVTNIWTDISSISAAATERLGYPTQKPEPLLERILKASSNEGDIVLDPFCGCGTTIAAAERLHRRWVGIDITHLAITLMRHRLHDTFESELTPYEVVGVPRDIGGATALALEDRYQFEWWALGLIDARPAHDRKKGADTGIDGWIAFFDDNSGAAKRIVVSVKSGHVSAPMVRELEMVRQREKAVIGLLLTLQEPTREMVREAAGTGFYVPELFPHNRYPRIQIYTIRELLEGRQPEYPRLAVETFKRAERKSKMSRQGELF